MQGKAIRRPAESKGGRRVARSEKVKSHNGLKAQELAFVNALTTPPFPTIADAGLAAGYDDEYAYRLRHKPHIVAAIQERCEAIERENIATLAAVTATYGRRALRNEDALGVAQANVFLKAMGRGDTNIVTSITNNAQTPLEDRIRGCFERDKAISQDS